MKQDFILNFHGIGATARPYDPGEQPFWVTERFFRDVVARIANAGRSGAIGVTFDDGNASDIAIALPILQEERIVATFFVLAGRLDAPGFLRREDVMALDGAGMMIGSHGFGHVDWRRLDAAGRRREMVEARDTIQAVCTRPVTAAAIPFGAYDRTVLRHLKTAGYDAIYTSDGGRAGGGPVFSRTSIRGDMTLADIDALLSGRESALRSLRRTAAILRKRLL